MKVCKFCDRAFTGSRENHSVIYHEKYCKLNPEPGIKPGGNQYTKAEREGRPKPVVSVETREVLSKISRAIRWTDEQKAAHSERMRRAAINNPESYSSANRGRTKQIEIDGIKLQGGWELIFYVWAKDNGLNPERPSAGFPYIFEGNRTYYPDFYLPDLGIYVEVKGYETNKDRAKWLQFRDKLCIIKKEQIDAITNGRFTVKDLVATEA